MMFAAALGQIFDFLRLTRNQIRSRPPVCISSQLPRDPVVPGTAFGATRGAEKAGRHGKCLDAELLETVRMLAQDEPLPRRYFDHPLGGEWNDHRDCHIRPDLILIYRKPDEASLELVRLGSHSELGL